MYSLETNLAHVCEYLLLSVQCRDAACEARANDVA
jgi:hypothetical protein